MNIKTIPILENIEEKEFPEYIKNKEYSCLKFIKKNKSKIKQITKFKIDCEFLGSPDFFIWKEKKYWFCEFKSRNDSLRNAQLCWFFNNPKLPKAIAFVLSNNKNYKEILKRKRKNKDKDELKRKRQENARWKK